MHFKYTTSTSSSFFVFLQNGWSTKKHRTWATKHSWNQIKFHEVSIFINNNISKALKTYPTIHSKKKRKKQKMQTFHLKKQQTLGFSLPIICTILLWVIQSCCDGGSWRSRRWREWVVRWWRCQSWAWEPLMSATIYTQCLPNWRLPKPHPR